MFRIFFKSWQIAFRTKRRLLVFTTAYAILLVWIAFYLRTWLSNIFNIQIFNTLLYSLIGGAIMGIAFAWWLAHGRRDDVATLKCIGWSNNDIRQLVLGETIFITFLSLALITMFAIFISGLWLTYVVAFNSIFDMTGPLIVLVDPFIRSMLFRPDLMWASFGVVMVSQIPGILLLTWRILRISPMKALSRAE